MQKILFVIQKKRKTRQNIDFKYYAFKKKYVERKFVEIMMSRQLKIISYQVSYKILSQLKQIQQNND